MSNNLTPYEALMACVDKAGTQVALADALGCSQTSVWKMLQVKRMSYQYVLTAERLYGVSRHDLRPDIYPRETMVDRGSAGRFLGVDRHADLRGAA